MFSQLACLPGPASRSWPLLSQVLAHNQGALHRGSPDTPQALPRAPRKVEAAGSGSGRKGATRGIPATAPSPVPAVTL